MIQGVFHLNCFHLSRLLIFECWRRDCYVFFAGFDAHLKKTFKRIHFFSRWRKSPYVIIEYDSKSFSPQLFSFIQTFQFWVLTKRLSCCSCVSEWAGLAVNFSADEECVMLQLWFWTRWISYQKRLSILFGGPWKNIVPLADWFCAVTAHQKSLKPFVPDVWIFA